MIKVVNHIKVYEVDGKECHSIAESTSIEVLSHWNRRTMVVIKCEGGKKLTIAANDLIAAINNATNTNSI